MARPKKPTELKLLEGTFRPDRYKPKNDNDLMRPEYFCYENAPSELSGESRKTWYDLGKFLAGNGLLSAPDMPAFALLCSRLTDYFDYKNKCEPVVEDSEGSQGQPIKVINPYVKLSREAWQDCVMLLKEFHLTPKSRG